MSVLFFEGDPGSRQSVHMSMAVFRGPSPQALSSKEVVGLKLES